MERAVAVKKLAKMLGKKFCYRIDRKAPTPEQRATAKAQVASAVAKKNEITQKLTERKDAILAADPEYQALLVEAKAARKNADDLSGISHHYKITVGLNEGLFFLVKAEGDSWEDVIQKVEGKA